MEKYNFKSTNEDLQTIRNIYLSTPSIICSNYDDIIENSISHNHIATLEFILQTKYPFININMANKLFKFCYTKNHVEIMKLLFKKYRNFPDISNAFNFCFRYSDFQIVEFFLRENCEICRNDYYNALYHFCAAGRTDLIKLIISLPNNPFSTKEYTDAFYRSCERNNFEAALFIYNIPGASVDINYGYDGAFRRACEYGNIKEIYFLLNISNNNININALDDYAFRASCENGHLNVVQMLLNLPNNNIDITSTNHYAFRYACKNGHINIVKYLLSISDYYTKGIPYNDGFKYSCSNNHFDLTKYLLRIAGNNINIDGNNDCNINILIVCCIKGYLDLVTFLWDIFKDSMSKENINKCLKYVCNNFCQVVDYKTVRVLFESGKITKETIDFIVKKDGCYKNKGLMKVLFDYCYRPIDEKIMELFDKYKQDEINAISKIITDEIIILDLWKLIFEYY